MLFHGIFSDAPCTELVKDNKYQARVLTRDANNARAQKLASLPGVELVQGSFANEETLRKGFRGCDGAVSPFRAFQMLRNLDFWDQGICQCG